MSSRGLALLLLPAATACRIGFDLRADATVSASDAISSTCLVHPCSDEGIYRSVGPGNLAALALGAGNSMTITGATATFSSSVPDRVGVGDVVQYDASGDGTPDALAFIYERISPTEYLVASEAGGAPVATASDEDWAIFRAYSSLKDAGTGTRNTGITIPFDGWGVTHDLTGVGLPWHIACYGDAVDTNKVLIKGWNTSATAYLRIFTPVEPFEVGASQRHSGRWDPGKYSLQPPPTSNNLALAIEDAFVRVEGLQVFIDSDNDPGDLPYGIDLTGFSVPRVAYVGHNIVRGNDTPTPATSLQRGIKIYAIVPGQTLYTYNNIIYGLGGGIAVRGIEATGVGSTVYSYNNTFVDLFPALQGNDPADAFIVRNTVAFDCPSPCLGSTGTTTGSNNVGPEFDAAGIGVAPGSNTITDYFVADGDFHIGPTAQRAGELVDQGLDLSADPGAPFDRDVDNVLRQAPWDIGADER